MGVLKAGELDDHRKHGAPVAFDYVEPASQCDVATTVLLDRGENTESIFLHLFGIGYLYNIEDAIGGHGVSSVLANE